MPDRPATASEIIREALTREGSTISHVPKVDRGLRESALAALASLKTDLTESRREREGIAEELEAVAAELQAARAEILKWEKLPGGWEAMKAVSEEFNSQRGDLTARLVAQRRRIRELEAVRVEEKAALQAAQEALRERDEHVERLEALVTHYASLEGNPEQAAERLRMLRDHLAPEAKHAVAPVMNCQWCRDLNRQRFEQEQRV